MFTSKSNKYSKKNNQDGEDLDQEQKINYLHKAIDQTDNWIVITKENSDIIYANKTVEEITGYNENEIIGKKPSIFKSGKHNKQFYQELWQKIKADKVFKDIIINKKKNGELFYSEQTITPIKNQNDEIINYISVGRDITENKKLKNRINYISNYNINYDIPNKKALITKINNLIKINKIERMSLLVINIEDLKSLNDIYYKDNPQNSLIKTTINLLNSFLQKKKNILKIDQDNYLSYLNSNNFALILDSSNSIDDTYKILRDILKIFSKNITSKEEVFILDPRIGISIYPNDSTDSAQLLSQAELALINSKKNDFSFFDKKINKKIKKLNKKETELNKAVKNDEFILYYQPYYAYYGGEDKKVKGLEALLRWNSAERGILSPAEFISVLENSELIKKVGLMVIKKAAEQILKWQSQDLKIVPVSINLSAKQLADRDHLKEIFQIIKRNQIDNSLFRFEITESIAMEDVNYSLEIIKEMKANGFEVALDDFGTGYSSFSYLQKFPIDYLKIDISFIKKMLKNNENKKIVEIIIKIAHTLNLKTIAEGVEEKAQLKELKRLSNDYIQGYYYNPPLAADDISKILI